MALKGKRSCIKRVDVLGNAGLEGMAGVTGPGDIRCPKFLGSPLDVATIESSRCCLCRFAWFLFSIFLSKKNCNIYILAEQK